MVLDVPVNLAGTDVSFAPLGVGTWAWGDESTWGMGGYDGSLTEDTIAAAWSASLGAGVTFFDTAEVYGKGESERIIGRRLAADPGRRDNVVLATKFMPLPWKLRPTPALLAALRASVARLGVDHVDLYQIHGPVSLRGQGALADALAAAVEAGLTRAVGVSNYSVKEMCSMHAALAARGVPLASNQIEFSLLRRKPESSGLIAACHELDVVPLAYSPIGQGRLTGKYSAANPPAGNRGFSNHPMEAVDRVVAELRRVGETRPGPAGPRTPAQVALRWLIDKGAVPIPGAKNAEQAEQNAGALGWVLADDEMAALDAVALEQKESLAQRLFWQHG